MVLVLLLQCWSQACYFSSMLERKQSDLVYSGDFDQVLYMILTRVLWHNLQLWTLNSLKQKSLKYNPIKEFKIQPMLPSK